MNTHTKKRIGAISRRYLLRALLSLTFFSSIPTLAEENLSDLLHPLTLSKIDAPETSPSEKTAYLQKLMKTAAAIFADETEGEDSYFYSQNKSRTDQILRAKITDFFTHPIKFDSSATLHETMANMLVIAEKLHLNNDPLFQNLLRASTHQDFYISRIGLKDRLRHSWKALATFKLGLSIGVFSNLIWSATYDLMLTDEMRPQIAHAVDLLLTSSAPLPTKINIALDDISQTWRREYRQSSLDFLLQNLDHLNPVQQSRFAKAVEADRSHQIYKFTPGDATYESLKKLSNHPLQVALEKKSIEYSIEKRFENSTLKSELTVIPSTLTQETNEGTKLINGHVLSRKATRWGNFLNGGLAFSLSGVAGGMVVELLAPGAGIAGIPLGYWGLSSANHSLMNHRLNQPLFLGENGEVIEIPRSGPVYRALDKTLWQNRSMTTQTHKRRVIPLKVHLTMGLDGNLSTAEGDFIAPLEPAELTHPFFKEDLTRLRSCEGAYRGLEPKPEIGSGGAF